MPTQKRPRRTPDPYLTSPHENIQSPADLFNTSTLLRALDTNVVEYRLYPDPILLAQSTRQGKEVEALRELAAMVLSFTARWTAGHIWQKEGFFLEVGMRREEIDQPFLIGRTKFGDCIDDEWFIVFLLREITKEFPDLVASVHDNDGDFLLIESANHLPKTLTPTTSPNRTYISQGALHILPFPPSPAHPFLPRTPTVTLREGLKSVRAYPDLTVAGKEIAEAVWGRTDVFPGRLKEVRQRVRCFLPREIARWVLVEPGVVAEAVERFYLRDAERLK
ncbi:hypothetical protein HDU67_006562, partial [Dinochytrium kinnereticum]